MQPFTYDLKKGEALAEELKGTISGEIRFDKGSRALYATDSSNYRQVPVGVVIPKNIDDIVRTVELCRKYGTPILSRGGGTSLAGQCCNTAVVMDMSKYYNKVLHIDEANKLATVQPGIVLDALQKHTLPHGLRFGPDPATHDHCTIGGMIGNNSCGSHSIMAAFHGGGTRTSDNIHSMEILTYSGLRLKVGYTTHEELEQIISEGGERGEIYKKLKKICEKYGDQIRQRYPKIPRRVSGYNLDELLPEKGFNVARALVGSESTLVTVLTATVQLIPSLPHRQMVVLGYPDIFHAGEHAPEILKFKPVALEGIDDMLITYMKEKQMHHDDLKLLPNGNGWLLTEFGSNSEEETKKQVDSMVAWLKTQPNAPTINVFSDKEQQAKIWEIRESGLGATAFVPNLPDAWEGWEDAAVPPEKVGNYLKDFKNLLDKFGYETTLYGHFGDGCIHCRINFDLYSEPGIKHYRSFLEEASDLVISYGGSISGEHGDGQSKAELLPKMFGPELMQAFREFKEIWDPQWKMNPGKIIDPYPITSNLRLGAHYKPADPKTKFFYEEDKGSFARSALRCVGVGKCRREEGGTMCPSYMVTKEEMHSTRGRSRLLFEMLQGDVITEGWKSPHVKEALDLCLACKGCKGDCPLKVDMATYKAEFLSHYYKGKVRPLHAYVFGMINVWSGFASKMPQLTNFVMNGPLSGWIKSVVGIAPKRTMPKYANNTFRSWFEKRKPKERPGMKVILWPDTFNNYFHPNTAISAVEAMETLGFNVVIPKQVLCCGRPLYDFGMIDKARSYLKEILVSLKDDIEAGTMIVGLEPSCISVFRDELLRLFPNDMNAQRLSKQVLYFSEFIDKYVPEDKIPEMKRKAIVHGHCHHKSMTKMKEEEQAMKKLKLDYTILDSGCCGMAGAFGFEEKHYEVSVKSGERVLLPKVREAEDDTIIMTNGFSCREQISQQTGKRALHFAEVFNIALKKKK